MCPFRLNAICATFDLMAHENNGEYVVSETYFMWI